MYPFYEYPTDNSDKEEVEGLRNLPEYIQAKTHVSFNKDLSIEEVMNIINSNNVDVPWIAIRNGPKDQQRYPHFGFNPTGSGILFEKKDIDTTKYPYLNLGWIEDEKKISPEILENHFRSLVKYMSENKTFGKLDIIYEKNNEFYKEILDYIDKNGVKSYGMVVMGTPNEILKLRENPMVEHIYIEDTKLSLNKK